MDGRLSSSLNSNLSFFFVKSNGVLCAKQEKPRYEVASTSATSDFIAKYDPAHPINMTVCRFFQQGNCKFGSKSSAALHRQTTFTKA